MCTKVFYEKGSFSRPFLMVDVKKLPSINGQCLAEKVSSIIDNLKVIGLCGRDIVTGNHSAKLNVSSTGNHVRLQINYSTDHS